MRTLNLVVGLVQVAGGVALGAIAVQASPVLAVIYTAGMLVNCGMGGRTLACSLFGSRKDQWEV